MKRLLGLVAVVVLAGSGAAARATSLVQRPCTRWSDSGGEWPMYGGDLTNSRDQVAETTLVPAVASTLAPAWTFTTADGGAFNSTPAVSGGCAFIGSDKGVVYAFRADTGAVVWQRTLEAATPGLGGVIVGSPFVEGRQVIYLVNETGAPYAISLDRATGEVLWRSAPVDTTPGMYTNASPMVFDGVLFFGLSAPEGLSTGQGGWALLDAKTGAILKVVPTIPVADQAKGYAGGGIWTTPAYDARGHYAYVGAGNPNSKTMEHTYVNAILKIDMSRRHPTFGTVVRSYKGNVDQYTETLKVLSQTPACAASDVEDFAWPLDDPVCGQLDLDFGASPNLYRAQDGRLVVGELQKSGVYHAAAADDMSPRWTALIGGSCAACNAASTAVDANGIAAVGTPGGVLYSLGRDDGSRRWALPIGGGAHYQSMSTAAGVVYTIDTYGFLDAVDSTTGALILHRPMAADVGAATLQLGSSGIAIAGRTVFAPVASSIVAYRAV
jgi:polyvinyl alcohol dehydrogenase (cytochrome)